MFSNGEHSKLALDQPLCAFLDVVFAQDAVEAGSTFAHEAVDILLAEGAVLAGLAGALVHVGLTPFSLESQAASAGEAPDVVDTSATAQARIYRKAARERSYCHRRLIPRGKICVIIDDITQMSCAFTCEGTK